VITQIGILWRK